MDGVVDQAGTPVASDTGDPVDDGTEAESGLADIESELYFYVRDGHLGGRLRPRRRLLNSLLNSFLNSLRTRVVHRVGSGQAAQEPLAHAGPVLGQHREQHGVTNGPVGPTLIATQRAFVAGAEPCDGAL